ncbi:MAG TPA: RNA polymerase sigma factor [Spirochaetota bacterium]|nr:RNA polymerase sigma factor [Spirochaetota bacterium]
MYNPFTEIESDDDDKSLIGNVLQGDRKSLEKLILRNQGWIYNIAFKMVMDHDDASDITQEILIKFITGLSTYDPEKGAFRTWLYRIVANHVLTMKKKKFETRIHDFDTYTGLIEKLPDNRTFSHPDAGVLEEELKTGCLMGMLMCLNRRDRLVFLLGAVFNVNDVTGAEVMDITRENFRKILSRAREKLYSHMNGFCGVANPENRCRCSCKTKAFYDMGMLDPANTRYYKPDRKKVRDMLNRKLRHFDESFYGPFLDIFIDQPFYKSPDMVQWLRDMLRHDEFRGIFDIH